MISGSQLLLLAMHTTANIVGPAGTHLSPNGMAMTICLLIVAAILTCLQAHFANTMPHRQTRSGPIVPSLRRRLSTPRPRRY